MRAAWWLLLASCGRIGFDRVAADDASGDSLHADVAADTAAGLHWNGLVAYADQTCAIYDGTGYCWGNIGTGGTQTAEPVPFAFFENSADTAMAPGEQFTCWAWGNEVDCDGSPPGGLTTYTSTVPIVALSSGRSFVCLIDDAFRCWGTNSTGQLGVGDTTDRPTPTTVALSPSYNAVRAGDDHVCASGLAVPSVCWGHNDDGTIGAGSMTMPSYTTPQVVAGISALPQIAGWHACSLESGAVYCWGRNSEGELGDGGSSSTATPERILTGATFVASGGGPTDYDASCAIVAGHVECWGAGMYGRLGQGAAMGSSSPVAVVGLPAPAVAVAIGYDHACALLSSDEIWCWGRGDSGQLGNGLMTSSLAPVKVSM